MPFQRNAIRIPLKKRQVYVLAVVMEIPIFKCVVTAPIAPTIASLGSRAKIEQPIRSSIPFVPKPVQIVRVCVARVRMPMIYFFEKIMRWRMSVCDKVCKIKVLISGYGISDHDYMFAAQYGNKPR
jgi:hypothetical protein